VQPLQHHHNQAAIIALFRVVNLGNLHDAGRVSQLSAPVICSAGEA